MKLARIEHVRCNSPEATTYVWVPDDMTEDGLGTLVDAAQKAYLDTETALAKSPDAPPNPGYSPRYDADWNAGKTVAEVKAEHAAKKAAYDAWEARRNASRKTFTEHLVRVSDGLVKFFWDNEPDLEVAAQWGHRHGTVIEFGETDVNAKDFGRTPWPSDPVSDPGI